MPGKLALSVSQLNEYVRRVFQLDPMLRSIELKGEISNLKLHQTGMLFFTMKDEHAAISCVMYPEAVEQLRSMPFEGMRALASGGVTLYTKGGQVQFVANSLRPQGVGVLYERMLELKERLAAEGLFDRERKRALPLLPDTIGVVTSPTGAVIHDILNVSMRRNPMTRILLCPVRVQGPEAADEIVRAIAMLEKLDSVSVVIVARGGGSMEDLWTFNEERVVRAVAGCAKPVVSAVGHETDVTLCDLAADLRAPTPSAAAECVVPLLADLQAMLADARGALKEGAEAAILRAQTRLERDRMKLDAAHPRARIARNAERLQMMKKRLQAAHPKHRVEAEQARLVRLAATFRQAMRQRQERAENALSRRKRELELLSPYGVLARGYALILKDGAAVVSVGELAGGEHVTIRLSDGQAQAQIQTIGRKKSDDGEKEKGHV